MKEILTPEEKKYLRSVSNYLKSLGVNTGNIEFDVESGWDSVNWEEITQFSNRHGAEIPEGLIKILKKIINYVVEDDLAGHDIHEDSSWIHYIHFLSYQNQVYYLIRLNISLTNYHHRYSY